MASLLWSNICTLGRYDTGTVHSAIKHSPRSPESGKPNKAALQRRTWQGLGGGECCLASTNPELLTTVRKVRVITERRLELLAAATVHIHVIFLPHYWMFESTLLTIRSSTVKKQLRATLQYCCKTVGNRLKLRLKKE